MQYPLGPTHPGCTGCMTARRCAKVLVGGFQVVSGQHACRGGQTLQMALPDGIASIVSHDEASLDCIVDSSQGQACLN